MTLFYAPWGPCMVHNSQLEAQLELTDHELSRACAQSPVMKQECHRNPCDNRCGTRLARVHAQSASLLCMQFPSIHATCHSALAHCETSTYTCISSATQQFASVVAQVSSHVTAQHSYYGPGSHMCYNLHNLHVDDK